MKCVSGFLCLVGLISFPGAVMASEICGTLEDFRALGGDERPYLIKDDNLGMKASFVVPSTGGAAVSLSKSNKTQRVCIKGSVQFVSSTTKGPGYFLWFADSVYGFEK